METVSEPVPDIFQQDGGMVGRSEALLQMRLPPPNSQQSSSYLASDRTLSSSVLLPSSTNVNGHNCLFKNPVWQLPQESL